MPDYFIYKGKSQEYFLGQYFSHLVSSVLGVGRELVSDAVANLAEAFGTA